jgi:glucose/arabinose dehydrogenase
MGTFHPPANRLCRSTPLSITSTCLGLAALIATPFTAVAQPQEQQQGQAQQQEQAQQQDQQQERPQLPIPHMPHDEQSRQVGPVPAPIVPTEENGLLSASARNNTVRPEEREHTQEFLAQVQLPPGFSIRVFAEGLENPRIITVANGHIYVTEREAGRVTLLRDTNGDGRAETTPVAEGLGEGLSGVHGLAVSPQGQLYMVTETALYRSTIQENGSLTEPELVMENMPDGGQHPNRTMAFGPDGQLYISIGSSTNAIPEPKDLHATMVRLDPSIENPTVDDLQIYAEGLRNTIGFAWHPETGDLYGWDHNSDGRGDDWPPEEINRLEQGTHYGWPWCGGYREIDLMVPEGPEDMTRQEFCLQSGMPRLTYQGHTAGMQYVFYTGTQFPQEYRNDAYVTMRGSWNRNPPVGYGILRIRHNDEGVPVDAEPFAMGWLQDPEGRPAHYGRLTGLVQAPDGSLLVTNDSHGIVYRISYNGAP